MSDIKKGRALSYVHSLRITGFAAGLCLRHSGFCFGASVVVPLEMRDPWIAPDDLPKISCACVVSAPKTLHWHCTKMKSAQKMSKFLAGYGGSWSHLQRGGTTVSLFWWDLLNHGRS